MTSNLLQDYQAAVAKMSEGFLHFFGPDVLPNLQQLQALQLAAAEQHAQLMLNLTLAYAGQAQPPLRQSPKGDRRFTDNAWSSHPFYDYLRQAYYVNSELVEKIADLIPARDEAQKQRLRFFTKQYISAMAPSNFIATNPEALLATMGSHGTNLHHGMTNMLGDLSRGRISMSDERVFAVGKNLAVTPGAVVMQNELIELLQYAPATERVHRRPLLLVPPCINKFYILDLQVHNSFVRYAVERGFTVFLISWRNADKSIGKYTWDDYLRLGPLAALEAMSEITGATDANALGFCVGGTLLASALAVLGPQAQARVHSLTLLTTLLDFSDSGEIGDLVHPPLLQSLRHTIGDGGIFSGRDLASVFSSLRPNELIWNYVVNNYLKGTTPPPLDLLYWNSDATNLTGPFMCQYLEQMYLKNQLKTPNALTMCGVPIDLAAVNMPSFIYASREDHIVPWQSAYLSRALLGGQSTFVLGASGHIAGVINPPSQNKRSYWTSAHGGAAIAHGGAAIAYEGTDANTWFSQAQEHPGSWWPVWVKWLAERSGDSISPPTHLGSAEYPPLMAAPGSYVLERI